MKKIITIAGARPQFIKAAMVSRAFRRDNSRIREVLVHTGQHSDFLMSEIFFRELGLDAPSHHLGISGGSNASQVARMTEALEPVIQAERPDGILVYGDTNSTLAGALIAAHTRTPLIHVEAGMRSYNRNMPEETNRVICDHLSSLLFAPTDTAVRNLGDEGVGLKEYPRQLVIRTGDVMYDAALHFSSRATRPVTLPESVSEITGFVLCTVHRPVNADDPEKLRIILQSLHQLSERTGLHIVFPVHPRTNAQLRGIATLHDSSLVHFCDPFGYLDMLWLEQHASLIITDSGGVQKEAYFFHKPAVILREETEWTELVDSGAAVLCDVNERSLHTAYDNMLRLTLGDWPEFFGNGQTAEHMADAIDAFLA